MIIRRLKKWTYVVCLSFMLLAFWLVGQSLLFTKNTSASKHFINSIPLYSQSYLYTPESGTPSFISLELDDRILLGFPSDSIPDFDLSETHAPMRFTSYPGNNICSFDSSRGDIYNMGHWTSSNGVFTPGVIGAYDVSNSANTFSYCSRLVPFDSDGRWPFNDRSLDPSNLPGVNDHYISQQLKALLPYSFDYSALVLRGSVPIDGVYYDSHGFTFDELLGAANVSRIDSPNLFQFPIGTLRDIQSDDFTEVVAGTSLDFSFSILIDTYDGLDLSTFDSSVAELRWSGFDGVHSLSSTRGSVTCDKSYSLIDDDDLGANIDFNCHFVSPYNFYGNYLDFVFRWSSSNSVLFDADGLYIFGLEAGDQFFVVSNGDDTLGSPIGAKNVGSSPNLAPGSPIPDPENVDFITSLSNLFNFNIVNPFQPIFGLFIDSSTCYNIPIIAGMLNVDDAEHFQYCPWFPSSVRSVLTPVFGLSASMLLIGFIIRWLKSSSGNYEADSSGGRS